MKTVALIVAAGQGKRFGGEVPKQFRNIHNRPLLAWTIQRFEECGIIDEIILVTAEEYLLYTNEKIVNQFGFAKLKRIIKGGETRQESVYNGLKALSITTGFVAIHDGARPITDRNDLVNVIKAAGDSRAAILARPVSDTIKRVEGGYIMATIDRRRLYRAETPQVFQYDLIMSAYEKFREETEMTDDASMIEKLGFKVKIVETTRPNLKVTSNEDLEIAGLLMESKS